MTTNRFFIFVTLLSFLLSCQTTNNKEQLPVEESIQGDSKATYYIEKGQAAQKKDDGSTALVYFQMATRIDPNALEAYYQSGNVFFDRNENKEAISHFDKVVEYDENYKNVRFNRGLAYLSLEKYKEALAEFQYAISHNAQDIESHKNIGIIHLDYLKDDELARHHLKLYLDLGGKDIEVIQWLTQLGEDPQELMIPNALENSENN